MTTGQEHLPRVTGMQVSLGDSCASRTLGVSHLVTQTLVCVYIHKYLDRYIYKFTHTYMDVEGLFPVL